MATGTSATNQRKQRVFVYSKLQSHEKASLAVQKLLKEVCESMENIDVELYRDNYKLEDYLGVTVVVVIDDKQIRMMITPESKGGNVDNWNDLKMLSSKRTSPAGSILIVIYGDESSKDGNDLLATKWLQVSRYKLNDPRSSKYAEKNAIFSIYDQFNEQQKQSIKHYLRMIPLYPSITGKEMNILFLSPQSERNRINQFLDNNPFIVQQTVKKCGTCKAVTFSSYGQFKDSPTCLKVNFRDCNIINLPAEKPLKSVLEEILTSMKQDSHLGKCRDCRSFSPYFDRLIFFCNAREPFQISNQTKFRREIEELKNELACFNLQLRGEAFSIIKDEQKNESSDSTTGSAPSITKDESNDSKRSVIMFLKRQSKEPFRDQRKKTLQNIGDDLLCGLHAYHLMQSPTLFEPNLSLHEVERETMEKEKEALVSDIELCKTKLKVKNDRASDLEKRLTGKGEGWSWLKPSSWKN